MQFAARHAVGALWLVIVVVTSVFVYRSGFGSVVYVSAFALAG